MIIIRFCKEISKRAKIISKIIAQNNNVFSTGYVVCKFDHTIINVKQIAVSSKIQNMML